MRTYKKLCAKRSYVLFTNDLSEHQNLGLVELFAIADVIISDVSSVMLEAILLDTPLIFAYGHGRHRQADSVYEPISELTGFCERLDETNSSYPNQSIQTAIETGIRPALWQKTRNNVFFDPDGTSVASIAQVIKNHL